MTMPSNGPWGPGYSDPNAPHAVYEVWSGDECLYVGCSFRPTTRINVHANSSWWLGVTRVTWDYLPNRDAALAEEERRIKALRPKHNTIHNERPEDLTPWTAARRRNLRAKHARGEMCNPLNKHGCRECRLIWQAVRYSQSPTPEPTASASLESSLAEYRYGDRAEELRGLLR